MTYYQTLEGLSFIDSEQAFQGGDFNMPYFRVKPVVEERRERKRTM